METSSKVIHVRSLLFSPSATITEAITVAGMISYIPNRGSRHLHKYVGT